MSAMGSSATWRGFWATSGLPPKADVRRSRWHVRFVPIADKMIETHLISWRVYRAVPTGRPSMFLD